MKRKLSNAKLGTRNPEPCGPPRAGEGEGMPVTRTNNARPTQDTPSDVLPPPRGDWSAVALGMLAVVALAGVVLNGCKSAERPDHPEAKKSSAHSWRLAAKPANPGAAPGFLYDPTGHGTHIAGTSSHSLRSISDPGAFPSRDEELWVIARDKDSLPTRDEKAPGTGALMTRLPKAKDREPTEVPLPLKHTDVRAGVSGYIATVEVTQQFHNPFDSKIEAVYVFPLPENAAVNDFIMTIGERRIRGVIRERKEAERIYADAKSRGHVASLLTQERPNIFTQAVANIEPGRQIDVTIKYFSTLACVDGWYEFVFPMVVGPRYNPSSSADGIGATPRGQAGKSGQTVEVQYLKPGERSGHDIALRLEVNAGVPIEEFACRSHVVSREAPAPERFTCTLSPNDRVPNKDFVARWRVTGERVKSSLLTHRDARGGFFTLMLYPPNDTRQLARRPMEMVFLLDCSGSMSGTPLAQAKQAIERGLKQLEPGDSFQLINFSERASQLGPRPLEATPANVRRGLDYLAALKSDGPTEMIEGIKAALDFAHDERRFRFVSFMTDGYIGNEAQILSATSAKLGESRLFSFGVGSSVNRYLLDGLGRLGRGAVAYLGPRDSAGDVMDGFFQRISHPALTDVRVDWGGLEVAEVFPRRAPDLFVGRPVILTGRFKGKSATTVKVSGQVGDRRVSWEVPVNLADANAQHAGLPSVWARMKIADLCDDTLRERNADVPELLKKTALDFNLMSAFTAFVAVDASRRTEGAEGTTVPVAVPVPEGVKYRTTVP